MTSHLNDEALSAALDGCGSVADQEHLDRCSDCTGRLDALRKVQQTVGTPVALPLSADVESAVAAALAASPDTTLTQSGWDRHRGGSRTAGRLGAILAVAAAVVVVGAGVVALTRAVGHSSSAKSTSAQSRSLPASPPTTIPIVNGSPSAGPASAGATSTSVTPRPVQLGSFQDIDTLRSALRGLVAQGSSGSTAAAGPAGVCQPRPAPPKVVALVQWRGQAAVVFVYVGNGTSTATVLVMSIQGCGLLTSFPL
jgi:hypothetical protein